MAISRPKRVEKPWGYELIWVLHIRKGESLSYQYHQVKDETIYLLSGALDLEIGDEKGRETHHLKPADCYRISSGTKHRMTAVEDSDVLEASTPELDDVVRLEDRYGRIKT